MSVEGAGVALLKERDFPWPQFFLARLLHHWCLLQGSASTEHSTFQGSGACGRCFLCDNKLPLHSQILQHQVSAAAVSSAVSCAAWWPEGFVSQELSQITPLGVSVLRYLWWDIPLWRAFPSILEGKLLGSSSSVAPQQLFCHSLSKDVPSQTSPWSWPGRTCLGLLSQLHREWLPCLYICDSYIF